MSDETSTKSRKTRLLWVVAGLVLLMIAVRVSGLSSWLNQERIHQLVDRAGAWGPALFVVLFVGAVVGQIPGLLFVFAAPALFQLPEAFGLCYLASNLAVTLNFELVRRVGGQPLSNIENPWLLRLFAQLDKHPVRTVAVLRVITVMFPPVTSALALTPLRSRHHAMGSALGMLLPIAAILLVTRFLIAH